MRHQTDKELFKLSRSPRERKNQGNHGETRNFPRKPPAGKAPDNTGENQHARTGRGENPREHNARTARDNKARPDREQPLHSQSFDLTLARNLWTNAQRVQPRTGRNKKRCAVLVSAHRRVGAASPVLEMVPSNPAVWTLGSGCSDSSPKYRCTGRGPTSTKHGMILFDQLSIGSPLNTSRSATLTSSQK